MDLSSASLGANYLLSMPEPTASHAAADRALAELTDLLHDR